MIREDLFMAQKENQRIALTKKLLQEGLLRLLDGKTLDNISVTELCRESGINRATFYNHYSSPQDLLIDIENRVTNQLKLIIANLKTAEDATNLLVHVCEFFQENAATILALNRSHADTKITRALYDLNLTYQTQLVKNSKYANQATPEGLHLIAVFFYTGSYNILLEWISKNLPFTPKEVATMMLLLAKENALG